MAILDDAKLVLRITSTAYDGEINDLLNAADFNLAEAGIMLTNSAGAKEYKMKYVKANFGFNNPDADRLNILAEKQLQKLALLQDHIAE